MYLMYLFFLESLDIGILEDDALDTSMLISNDCSITEGAINSGRYG